MGRISPWLRMGSSSTSEPGGLDALVAEVETIDTLPRFEHHAVETVLKGLEVVLPDGAAFHDKDGHPRREIRTRWWQDSPASYRDLALVPEATLASVPDTPVADGLLPGYDGEKPVFIGHYWLRGEPRPLTADVACLDYSVAARQGGRLAAYRWDGRHPLSPERFTWVEA